MAGVRGPPRWIPARRPSFGYSGRVPSLSKLTLAILAWGTLAGSLCARSASAQDLECPNPEVGPLETTPSSGAENVTLDAYIKVRYSEDYFAGFDEGETLVSPLREPRPRARLRRAR